MDVPAILKRHPRVCLVDGLAWNNPPGSVNANRWQDVRQLLDAGIAVIASINIQYIAELQRSGGDNHRQARGPNGAAELPVWGR